MHTHNELNNIKKELEARLCECMCLQVIDHRVDDMIPMVLPNYNTLVEHRRPLQMILSSDRVTSEHLHQVIIITILLLLFPGSASVMCKTMG